MFFVCIKGSVVPDFSSMVSSPIEKHNLTLLAVDPESDNLLAVMINGEFHRSEIDAPQQEVGNT